MDLDSLNALLADLFPGTLGLTLTGASAEEVRASMLVRPDLCTAGKILHGGAVMAFADTLGAVATLLNLPPGGATATIESKTNFLAPAPVDSTVLGICTPLHRGRRTMTWQTRVESERGRLLALVIQTQIVLEGAPPTGD